MTWRDLSNGYLFRQSQWTCTCTNLKCPAHQHISRLNLRLLPSQSELIFHGIVNAPRFLHCFFFPLDSDVRPLIFFPIFVEFFNSHQKLIQFIRAFVFVIAEINTKWSTIFLKIYIFYSVNLFHFHLLIIFLRFKWLQFKGTSIPNCS